jgi:hypothetical protein
MTYNQAIEKSYSKKDFLAILRPAVQMESWTNYSGNVYYTDFQISNELIEYVYLVEWDGTQLIQMTGIPTTGKFYFDFQNKRLYINNGSDPSGNFITVFFEIYVGTKTVSTYRKPLDTSTDVVYYSPRILDAVIPQISSEDILLFGSYSGTIKLINTDGVFYIYEDVSFRRKEIEIYHFIDTIENIKLVYYGNIENLVKDDQSCTFSYKQIDFVFNRNFSTANPVYGDTSLTFLSYSDFALLDPKFAGIALRQVYGVVDDITPIGIDYSQTPSTTTNRDFIVRSLGSESLTNLQLVQNGSSVSRVYLPVNHGFFEGERVKVTVFSFGENVEVIGVGSNYIDVSPILSGVPITLFDTVKRSSIGYVDIYDENGVRYKLDYIRDYNEQIFTGLSTYSDALGFVLSDNFEANFPTFPTPFNPDTHKIVCRCYGILGPLSQRDPDYKVIMNGQYILNHILTENLGLLSSQVNSSDILALSLPKLSFSIPREIETSTPTYREVLKDFMTSTLTQIYYDDEFKINLRKIEPMGTSIRTITDSDLLDFSISYDGDTIYDYIRIFYRFKERPKGGDRSSWLTVKSISDKAKYLHKEKNTLEINTYLFDTSEAMTIADHYAIIFGDWSRSYSFKTKTQLMNLLIGEVVEFSREKMDGFNLVKNTLRNKKARISSIKKQINKIEFSCDPQTQIENSGGW